MGPHAREQDGAVERVTERMLFLRDSDEYTRIPRAETGIRPEDGWEIEDCYILRR